MHRLDQLCPKKPAKLLDSKWLRLTSRSKQIWAGYFYQPGSYHQNPSKLCVELLPRGADLNHDREETSPVSSRPKTLSINPERKRKAKPCYNEGALSDLAVSSGLPLTPASLPGTDSSPNTQERKPIGLSPGDSATDGENLRSQGSSRKRSRRASLSGLASE